MDNNQGLKQQTPIFPAAGHPKMSFSPWSQFHSETITLIKLHKIPFFSGLVPPPDFQLFLALLFLLLSQPRAQAALLDLCMQQIETSGPKHNFQSRIWCAQNIFDLFPQYLELATQSSVICLQHKLWEYESKVFGVSELLRLWRQNFSVHKKSKGINVK